MGNVCVWVVFGRCKGRCVCVGDGMECCQGNYKSDKTFKVYTQTCSQALMNHCKLNIRDVELDYTYTQKDELTISYMVVVGKDYTQEHRMHY